MSRFSETDSDGNTARPCGTNDRPLRTIFWGGSFVMSSAAKRTTPRRFGTRQNTALSAVDLPAPFGPMIATNSPGSTWSVTPSRICTEP